MLRPKLRGTSLAKLYTANMTFHYLPWGCTDFKQHMSTHTTNSFICIASTLLACTGKYIGRAFIASYTATGCDSCGKFRFRKHPNCQPTPQATITSFLCGGSLWSEINMEIQTVINLHVLYIHVHVLLGSFSVSL